MMPVKKFRTFEDASRDLLRQRDDDAAVVRRVAALWAFSASLVAPLGFRGVRKYSSLEEADADRQRMIREREEARRPEPRA
jgi:hypothetical protein